MPKCKIFGENQQSKSCEIADKYGDCIYHKHYIPPSKGKRCKYIPCLDCDSKRCSINPDGTISINDIPYKLGDDIKSS
ncbi:hypothetical protein M0R01_01755 [bacterium]|nr:hypothetical protein [bacterium]